ncbi:MAG TPA: DNA polymerase domain-containing protein [Candidatus Nanoarchaeia archaeon]|nr:DNA polymerase domain-containing protein [Candidatus Nanoarchaeia archaeon]
MKAWVMDAYRKENSIVLWLKTPENDFTVTRSFNHYIYLDIESKEFLDSKKIKYRGVRKKDYMRREISVLEVKVPWLSNFEAFVRYLEKETRHRVPFYNADITPEQMFFYKNDFLPCSTVEVDEGSIRPVLGETPVLSKMELKVNAEKDIYLNPDCKVVSIIVDSEKIEGDEVHVLSTFKQRFLSKDPDIIHAQFAFSRIPFLMRRFLANGIDFSFHRFDDVPLKYKGGRTFFTYGISRYREFAVRLHGRFLVDNSSFMGGACEADAIMELSQLSGMFLQQIASKSFGAAFQFRLIKEMVSQNLLVPFKEKPIEQPLSMLELLKTDRGGFTADPTVGFHEDVAELDFCSMFPWLIYNHNVSADTILSDEGPFEHVPGTPFKISLRHKGLAAAGIKKFLDRRMEYKRNPTAVNKAKAAGLKWVLVSSYGYLRFREFKLGVSSAHMSICAFAREILVKLSRVAESMGFEVVHSIVDSIYIKKKGITEKEVKEFCREIELETGIPISVEGIFKWIVFLPSINDNARPVPTRYFGVYRNGEIKARGIEVRQSSCPLIIKEFQKECLRVLGKCSGKMEIRESIPELYKLMEEYSKKVGKAPAALLVSALRISKEDYKNDIPQRTIISSLKKKGITIRAGEYINFVFSSRGPVIPEDYSGNPDFSHYRKLFIRSLYSILQPFGVEREKISFKYDRQKTLSDYMSVKNVYIPMLSQPPEKRGLSEKIIKKRLVLQGWTVWKGGLLGIEKVSEYPNFIRKYILLKQLLSKVDEKLPEELEYMSNVHHGMPDYICYRNGKFKFVECKLQYELLSDKQKKCLMKLKGMGFDVEVHRLVDRRTKAREAMVDVVNGGKMIMEVQNRLVTPH